MNLIDDTLKKIDSNTGKLRSSRTSLTMFSAWGSALSMTWVNFLFGVKLDFSVFLTLVSVGTGIKIADAVSNRLIKK